MRGKGTKTSRINQNSSLFDLKQNIFVRRMEAFDRGKPEVRTTFVAFFTILLHFFPFFFLLESKNPFSFVGRGLGLQGIPRKKNGPQNLPPRWCRKEFYFRIFGILQESNSFFILILQMCFLSFMFRAKTRSIKSKKNYFSNCVED